MSQLVCYKIISNDFFITHFNLRYDFIQNLFQVVINRYYIISHFVLRDGFYYKLLESVHSR